MERVRCAVFADLHGRGLTMTTGIKFGADFLAYPGDPMAYHAGFCVRVVDDETPMRCQLLAGVARMSHGARKNLVLASATPIDGAPAGTMRVEYRHRHAGRRAELQRAVPNQGLNRRVCS